MPKVFFGNVTVMGLMAKEEALTNHTLTHLWSGGVWESEGLTPQTSQESCCFFFPFAFLQSETVPCRVRSEIKTKNICFAL